MLCFKPVQEAGDDSTVDWVLYPQGDYARPVAIVDDQTMQKAVIQWLKLHPTAAKEIAAQSWIGK